MNTYTASFSTNPYISQGSYVIEHDTINLKGKTKVIIDLSQIDESVTYVKNINVTWGDGSANTTAFLNIVKDYYTESIISEVLYNKDVSVCTTYDHIFYPTNAAYFTQYQCVIKLTFMNDFVGTIYIPFKVAQASYYDDIGDMFVNNTQLIPLSASNVILNMQATNEKYIVPVITN
jgi:hypothetical protein